MEIKKGGDLICKRPETVIEARYNLNKRQNDVLDMVFASIEDDDKLKYEIDIAKYGQLYNIKDKSNIYRDLKRAVTSFEGKGFSLTQKVSEKRESRIYFNWFSHIVYIDGESKIIIGLDPMLKKLMLNAKQACFYQIKYPLNFHNIYSKRIYYYLKSYENSNKNGTGWRIDNLDELRIKLECPKTYERYADFKRFVLKPAYDEINGNSDISFEYEEIKTKGKVTSIKFSINRPTTTIALPNEIDEISATSIKLEQEKHIKKVMAIMNQHEIEEFEAKKIYDSSNCDLIQIEKCYKYCCEKKVNNIVGYMIRLVKPGEYIEPKQNIPKDAFNNYEQREYDYNDLEKKLLGLE
jgi:plasmid replication initiation protein